VNVRNYIDSHRSNYKLLRRYGPSSLGVIPTVYCFLLDRLKILAYQVFGFVNAQSILAHRCSERLLPHESLSASQIVRDILRTPLPGFSSPLEKGSLAQTVGEGVPGKQPSVALSAEATIRS
jgi:hypothetical protein